MKQLTVRGFEKELERRIRALARREGLSLNQAALRLLRKGAGLEEEAPRFDVVGSSLDPFIGTWSDAEARELEKALQVFARVDEDLWK